MPDVQQSSRPGQKSGLLHVAVRLDRPTIDRIDALLPTMSAPWHRATRSDVLRALVHEALPGLEARPASLPRRKGGGR
jgi:hypothetical protein